MTFLRARQYAYLAWSYEKSGWPGVAAMFDRKAQDACEAQFETVCAERDAMVPVARVAIERRAVRA